MSKEIVSFVAAKSFSQDLCLKHEINISAFGSVARQDSCISVAVVLKYKQSIAKQDKILQFTQRKYQDPLSKYVTLSIQPFLLRICSIFFQKTDAQLLLVIKAVHSIMVCSNFCYKCA